MHHFKTTFTRPGSESIAGVPSSQAPTGYLITVHHLCAFLPVMKSARYLIDVVFITFVRNSRVALLQVVCPQSLSSAPLSQAPVPGYRQVIPLVC